MMMMVIEGFLTSDYGMVFTVICEYTLLLSTVLSIIAPRAFME